MSLNPFNQSHDICSLCSPGAPAGSVLQAARRKAPQRSHPIFPYPDSAADAAPSLENLLNRPSIRLRSRASPTSSVACPAITGRLDRPLPPSLRNGMKPYLHRPTLKLNRPTQHPKILRAQVGIQTRPGLPLREYKEEVLVLHVAAEPSVYTPG